MFFFFFLGVLRHQLAVIDRSYILDFNFELKRFGRWEWEKEVQKQNMRLCSSNGDPCQNQIPVFFIWKRNMFWKFTN